MRKIAMAAAAALLAAGWAPTQAAGVNGDAAAGKAKADQVCAACHQAAGEGNAELGYPKLAGQWDTYLVRALKDYRSGARQNAIMNGLAAALTDQEIDDLATYYSSMPDGLKTLAH